MAGKAWTDDEDEFLRSNYSQLTAKQIANQLGRTAGGVYQRCKSIGLSQERSTEIINDRDQEIRRLHQLGWSASEMESIVGITLRAINHRLNVLGLKPHGRSERYRKRVAEKTQAQCEAAGVRNLAELRSVNMKRVARSLGWPDHLRLRSVQILETLYQLGPMTRRQIADAIGVQWKGSRKAFATSRAEGGGYLAELQRAGLVIRLQKAVTAKGKGRSHDLYMVALEVEPCHETRKRYQSQKSSDQSSSTAARSQCKAS